MKRLHSSRSALLRCIGTLALLVALARPAHAHTPGDDGVRPQDLLVYYGWPSSINGTFSVDGAAAVFEQYGYVVLGDGLQADSHPDHANTTAILAHSALDETNVFGYVDLGVTTQNLPMADLKARVDAWAATGVDGIFLDDFGYDYEVTRARQNEAVAYVHALGLAVIANAWIPDHAFGTAVDAAYNPGGAAPLLGSADFYFSESFQVINGAYADGAAWRAKADALVAYQRDLGFGILSITTPGTAGTYDEDAFFYAWYSALLDGHTATGWGEPGYAASTAQAPFRTRPQVAPGTIFLGAPVVQGSVVTRTTDTGTIRIDMQQHTFSFGATDTGVEEADGPDAVTLGQNYPNPFSATTTIAFELGAAGPVQLEVYDLLGRRVATLVEEPLPAGPHAFRLDGRGLAGGPYVYRLVAGSTRETRTMVVAR